jgi:hypothetical protein
MDRPTAIGAVDHELSELPLEVGLHTKQLQPQHLRVDRDLMRAVEAGSDRLVDECVGLRCLLAYSFDGALWMSRSWRAMAAMVGEREDKRGSGSRRGMVREPLSVPRTPWGKASPRPEGWVRGSR